MRIDAFCHIEYQCSLKERLHVSGLQNSTLCLQAAHSFSHEEVQIQQMMRSHLGQHLPKALAH